VNSATECFLWSNCSCSFSDPCLVSPASVQPSSVWPRSTAHLVLERSQMVHHQAAEADYTQTFTIQNFTICHSTMFISRRNYVKMDNNMYIWLTLFFLTAHLCLKNKINKNQQSIMINIMHCQTEWPFSTALLAKQLRLVWSYTLMTPCVLHTCWLLRRAEYERCDTLTHCVLFGHG